MQKKIHVKSRNYKLWLILLILMMLLKCTDASKSQNIVINTTPFEKELCYLICLVMRRNNAHGRIIVQLIMSYLPGMPCKLNLPSKIALGRFAPHQQWFVTSGYCSEDNKMHLWDAKTGTCVRSFEGCQDVNAVAISRDQSFAVTAHRLSASLKLFSMKEEYALEMRFAEYRGFVNSCCIFMKDTQIVALCGENFNRCVRVWDIQSRKSIYTIERDAPNAITQLCVVSGNDQWLVTGSDHTLTDSIHTVTVWTLDSILSPSTVAVLTGHRFPVSTGAFSHNNQFLVTADRESVFVWRTSTWLLHAQKYNWTGYSDPHHITNNGIVLSSGPMGVLGWDANHPSRRQIYWRPADPQSKIVFTTLAVYEPSLIIGVDNGQIDVVPLAFFLEEDQY